MMNEKEALLLIPLVHEHLGTSAMYRFSPQVINFFDVVRNSLEKQVPKKVRQAEFTEINAKVCPMCGQEFGLNTGFRFCDNCGQALDFGEVKND